MTGELIEKEIANVLESPVVESLELSRKVLPMLNESAQKVIAFVGRQASGTTGEGIIIGIIDTGIDLANPDFQHTDANTRIISLWDQTLTGTGPYDFGYGVECTETDINIDSCAQVDVDGHGTHVAGIAAGNGNNNSETVDEYYIGMAPEADLVIVKTAFYQNDIINGIDYIARKAISQGKPWVVNLSLGTIWGTRDGTSDFEYAINSLQNQANNDGVVIVASGNSGYDSSNTEVIYNATHWNINRDHIRYSFNGTYEFTVENTNPWPYYVGGNRIDDFVNFLIFYPAYSNYGIRVSTPNDAPVLLTDGTWGPPLSYYLTNPIEGGTTFGVFTQDGGV